MTPQEILLKYFGYADFRGQQTKIINSIISGKDTFVIMPTGGGKSLCYQIPGLYFPGTTVVISPLISLMQDQVQALQQRGIQATFLNSSLQQSELEMRLSNLSKYKFIYLAPERLTSQKMVELFNQIEISLIAVDEAHCISEWGHDFRPPYLQISQFVKKLNSDPPVIALTATATPKTQQEIVGSLELQNPNIFLGNFTRDNLQLIIKKNRSFVEKEIDLIKIIKRHKDNSGIIYTQTRQQAEELSELINYYFPKYNCRFYHGGMNSDDRKCIQEKFINNEINLITATNAFGMGVDKANVRFVIHWGPSSSIENYYQEVGRAGRDGIKSKCYLLYIEKDFSINQKLICNSNSLQQKRKIEKLNQLENLIKSKQCLNRLINKYFGDKSNKKDTCDCYNCKPIRLMFEKDEQQLAKKLINLRDRLNKKTKVKKNYILTDQLIAYLTLLRPQTKSELMKIPGIGPGWVNAWSDDIMSLV